jgi:CO/xanthine dehydrogenase Mo-binding subunit
MIDASIPNGKIISIDTSDAEKLPGVCAVHVIKDVYGVAEPRDQSLESGHWRQSALHSCPVLHRIEMMAGISRCWDEGLHGN